MKVAFWVRKLHVHIKRMPVIINQSRFEFMMNLLNNFLFVLISEVWLDEHVGEFIKST
jgi:hypothetical protein